MTLSCLSSSNFITAKFALEQQCALLHFWSTLLDYLLNNKDEWRVHNAAEWLAAMVMCICGDERDGCASALL